MIESDSDFLEVKTKAKRREGKIMAMYTRGMRIRNIQATLLEIYNVEVQL